MPMDQWAEAFVKEHAPECRGPTGKHIWHPQAVKGSDMYFCGYCAKKVSGMEYRATEAARVNAELAQSIWQENLEVHTITCPQDLLPQWLISAECLMTAEPPMVYGVWHTYAPGSRYDAKWLSDGKPDTLFRTMNRKAAEERAEIMRSQYRGDLYEVRPVRQNVLETFRHLYMTGQGLLLALPGASDEIQQALDNLEILLRDHVA